jgi:hypothetical protein
MLVVLDGLDQWCRAEGAPVSGRTKQQHAERVSVGPRARP